ncbi:MAG TPA: IS1595 family transposase [Rhizomicrobium sp.]|jgi:transposase-like protein|nr:IS1595 family transposase [Rhizomicrobium sp.]
MSKSIFSAPHFNNEEAAFAFIEERLWPDGPVCPHCGVVDRAGRLKGKSNRPGLWKCYACRKPFTVKVGTIFEDSHIAMRDWLTAIHLLCSSKKGVSSNQLHRTLGITLKSAWHMSHRLREAMAIHGPQEPMGGMGKVVEADETYMGKRKGKPTGRSTFVTGFGWTQPAARIPTERKIMALVERGGKARSFHVESVNLKTARHLLQENVSPDSSLVTDEAAIYTRPGWMFREHHTVNHGEEEWVRDWAHTNTVEGYFSIFKRGIKGTYQHCKEKHLHRYLAEFDFRYSNRVALGVNDNARADRALKGSVGKRLTYRTTRQQQAPHS